jgi:hypothetical protein
MELQILLKEHVRRSIIVKIKNQAHVEVVKLRVLVEVKVKAEAVEGVF